jgi:uncharacterized membrane protein YhaH (DUF805 family)/uncharacterized protein YndB with AHSA1/START domain
MFRLQNSAFDPNIPRSQVSYLLWGVILGGLKWRVERFLISHYFGSDALEQFGMLHWFSPPAWVFEAFARNQSPEFFVLTLGLSIVCIFIGIFMTCQRIVDARLPRALVLLFFVPVINVIFFLTLVSIPSREGETAPGGTRLFERVPASKSASAIIGIVISVAFSLVILLFSTQVLNEYGSGLFLGAPFMIGFLSSITYSARERRTLNECIAVAFLATTVAGACLLGFALEGIICLAMAAPIAYTLAAIGALLAFCIQATPSLLRTSTMSCLALPLLMAMVPESSPSRLEAKTEVTIAAPPEVVWQYVVEFTELEAPTELLFKMGISYPIRARIEGTGVGAIRYCEFSTGAFVEPITAWEPPTRLRFSVAETPPPMEEWSPWGHIEPRHLSGFFESKEGEFLLTRLEDGSTRLLGTTWYEHRIFPERYWQLFSDPFLHSIHRRVLLSIKQRSESAISRVVPQGPVAKLPH